MNVRKLWSATLTEWILGVAVALGCIAPSAALSTLTGGAVPCAGSLETDCSGGTSCLFSGEMPHFCACYQTDPPSSNGICRFDANPCVAPCFVPAGLAPGHCTGNDTCYY
jgi:hypothetical protein